MALSAVELFNNLSEEECIDATLKCCGSSRFARALVSARPFLNIQNLEIAAHAIWWSDVDVSGWLEAFSAHPRIGDIEALKSKFNSTSTWCEGEQEVAIQSSNEAVLNELLEWNIKYENKFDHIFIICASGKTSSHILSSIKERYANSPIYEIQIAAKEQEKITNIRFNKLFSDLARDANAQNDDAHALIGCNKAEARLGNITGHLNPSIVNAGSSEAFVKHDQATVESTPTYVSSGQLTIKQDQLAIDSVQASHALRPPITTHVLDVALGRPAVGMRVSLRKLVSSDSNEPSRDSPTWQQVGDSVTNSDGRSGPLMPSSSIIDHGAYELSFHTEDYFLKAHGKPGFYPFVNVKFVIPPSQVREHFHVPLLLSPFGYNTYRGS